MIYILLTFLFLQVTPDSIGISKETEQQLVTYIQEIEGEQRIDVNIWAINKIAITNCEHLNYTKGKTSHLDEKFRVLSKYDCETLNTDDENLLNDHLNYSSNNLRTLYQNIVQDSLITEELLGFDEHKLIHYKFLVEPNNSGFYDLTTYLPNALDFWVEQVRDHKIRHNLDLALTLALIVRASLILDRYDLIEEFDEQFLESTYLPSAIDKLRLLGAIDYTYYRFGNYAKSLDLLRKHSIPLAKTLSNPEILSALKNRQGAYLFELGKYHESLEIYEDIYTNSESFEKQYELFTNLGINYLKIGDSDRYLNFQLQALDQDVQNYKSKLTIYRNLISHYTSIKDFNSVLEYFDKAKDLASQENDSTELALIDMYKSEFYQTAYLDYSKALEYLRSAENDINPEAQYGMYIDLILEKAYILTKTNSLNEAQKVFEESKDLALSKSDTPNYVDALVNLADINLKKGQLHMAKQHLEEISLYPRDNLDFELLVKYFTVKADFHSKNNDNRQAIEVIQPVITQVIERAKNNTDSQQGFWTIEDEYLDAFQLILRLYLEENDMQNALSTLEQFKTINDASLYNSPLIKANKLSESDLAEEKILSDRLQSLRNKYLNASEADRFEIKRQMDQVSAQREEILSKVEVEKKSSIPSLWKLQRSINPNELVLHFTEIGNELYVSHVTINDIRIKRLPFEPEDKERFNNIADNLASGFTNLEDLYDLYVSLDLDIPKHTELITVIPDNYLYRIPLEVLPTRSPDSPVSFGSTRYMIEDHHFRYFTSLKEYDGNRRTLSNGLENDFAAFAISDFKDFTINDLPSLPFATVESRNIENALTSLGQKKVFNGDQATKEAFKRSVENSRLVHVATHSEVSEQNPLFSTIYLNNPDAEADLESEQALYAYELFDTPLNSEFIMLNSCSSGSGNYIQGSGIMGISRALRYAGAKSLALNIWSVNDKIASEFATDLYSYLNEGHTKSESIRMAKLNQLRSANANPHFWGAYMLIGNPSPITEDHNGFMLIVSLLSTTSIFFGYTAYKKAA